MRSWNSHESGTARLVQMRGAVRHQAPMPKRILEELRHSSVRACSSISRRLILSISY